MTGATRNIGRRTGDHLIDPGADDIRALTDNPAKAKLPDPKLTGTPAESVAQRAARNAELFR